MKKNSKKLNIEYDYPLVYNSQSYLNDLGV